MNAIAKRQWPLVKYDVAQLGATTTAQGVSPGGLDLTTPSLRLPPGVLRDGLNFECAQAGGYARIEGYERLDGRAAPSAATVTIVQVVSFTNVPTVGQVVTQATSGATGTIVGVVGVPSPYIAVTRITGTFDATHALTTPGPVSVGTATTRTVVPTAKALAMAIGEAADVYRALIGAVPGSGAILGVVGMVFSNADNVYAFRANAGATAVAIYKATAFGWVLVPFYKIVSFTAGGTATPLDGEVLTQGAVTATVKRVMTQNQTLPWAGAATGQFVITTPVGGTTHFVAGAATLSGGATVTLSGAEAAISLAPGGRFEFVKCNFSGDIKTRRIYGCDGINQCFEFDGDVLTPIATGLSPDVPSHVAFHKNYLVVSDGSSLLGSAPGFPFIWDATLGAWEIATGDVVNGMLTLPGDQTVATLAVSLRGNMAFLYGTDPTTFNFVKFNTNIGALPYTLQNMFDMFFLDALGVVTLKASLNWGNFLPASLTSNILPFIARERTRITASAINRTKSQYRLFFSDGYALYCTIVNQQYVGAIPQLFPNPIFCCDETTLANGVEATYFGSTDALGYVYQLDKGTSFDGVALNAYFITAWDPIKSPRILKRFRAVSLEVQGNGYAELRYGYQLGYASNMIAQPPAVGALLNLSPRAIWDEMIWEDFVWDGVLLQPTDVDEVGTAENIQVGVFTGTTYTPAFTLNSVIHHYSLRRGLRV